VSIATEHAARPCISIGLSCNACTVKHMVLPSHVGRLNVRGHGTQAQVHHKVFCTMLSLTVVRARRVEHWRKYVHDACRKLRFDAIRQLRWHGRALPPELKTQLSPLEQQYFKSYDKLLTRYMSKGEDGVGMDLTLVSLLCLLLPGQAMVLANDCLTSMRSPDHTGESPHLHNVMMRDCRTRRHPRTPASRSEC